MEDTSVAPVSEKFGEAGLSWWGCRPNTDPEVARAQFTVKYGYPPERIVKTGGCLLVGPIRQKEMDNG